MSRKSLRIDDGLQAYLKDLLAEEPKVLVRLRQKTAELECANMQIGWQQGRLLTLLLRCLAARQTIEIGVFTGYSALVTALALPDTGRVVACDSNETWTGIARRYWREAGVADKIDLRIGPASDTLDAMLTGGEAAAYDFAFIDADKTGYDGYYERCLKLLRPGGLIAVDNALWNGAVVNTADDSADTRAIRALNGKIARDSRVEAFLAPVGDGVHLAWKR